MGSFFRWWDASGFILVSFTSIFIHFLYRRSVRLSHHDKQLSSCLTSCVLLGERKTSVASFAIFFFSVTFIIEIFPSP